MGRPMGSKNKKKSQINLIIDDKFRDVIEADGPWYYQHGYAIRICNLTRNKLLLHRVVYELAHGPIPAGLQIDHIDGNRSNNFLANLRLVTHQENQWNRTKAKGYSWNKQCKKWKADIKLNGKKIFLGLYSSEDEARTAYLEAKKIYHVIPDHNKNIADAEWSDYVI